MSEKLRVEVEFEVKDASKNAKELADEVRNFQSQLSKTDAKKMTETVCRLQTNIKQAQETIKLFGVSSKDIKRQQDVIRKSVSDLTAKGFDPQSKSIQALVKNYTALGNTSSRSTKAAGDSGKSMRNAVVAGNLYADMLVKVARAGVDFVKSSVKAAGATEMLRTNLETALGSTERAAAALEKIRDQAAATPFSLNDVADSFIQLKNSSVAISQIPDTINMIGDAAGGNSEKFNRILQNYTQIMSMGRAETQDIKQFASANLPIYEALADVLGVTTNEVKNFASEGKITSDVIEQAFKKMTSEGGAFFDGMKKGAETFQGRMSTLKDSVGNLLSQYGELVWLNMLKSGAIKLTEYVDKGAAFLAELNQFKGLKEKIDGGTATKSEQLLYYTNQLELFQKDMDTAKQHYESLQKIMTEGEKNAKYVNQDMMNKAFQDLNDANKEVRILTGIIKDLNKDIKSQTDADAAEEVLNAKVKEGNNLLGKRDELYRSTTDYQIEQLEAQLAFVESLRNARVTNEDGSTSGLNQGKTDAIINKLQAELESLRQKGEKDIADFTTEWFDKNLLGVFALEAEQRAAQKKLAEEAKKSFGGGYILQKTYADQLNALNFYYADKINDYKTSEAERLAETERDRVLNAHQEKLRLIEEETRYRMEKARENIESGNGSAGDYMQFAGASAQTAMQGTDIGMMIGGSDPWLALIQIIVKTAMSLESVKTALNGVSEIIGAVFEPWEEAATIDVKSIIDSVKEVSSFIAQVLSPVLGVFSTLIRLVAGSLRIVLAPLQLVGKAFEWFYMSVIRPVGNAIIEAINWVIGALNKIPFVDIDKLDYLPLIGKAAEEAAEAMERAKEEITKMYDRQKQAVQDEMRSQIDSIKSQYELGLISRDQYTKQAEQYQKTADAELVDINEQMLKELDLISRNTGAVLSDKQKESVNNSYAQKWGETVPILGHIAGGVVDFFAGIGNWFKGLFGFDVGTSFIPHDMPAMVHHGEGIIPKTFNEGIQRGDYALVGRNDRGNSGGDTYIQVYITVEGTVIEERNLASTIYDGIASLISGGQRSPLPA